MKKKHICDFCGKTFERYICEVRGKKKYCSQKCHYKNNPWNKEIKGKEYAKHYKNGFGGHKNKGKIAWNSGKMEKSQYVKCEQCKQIFKAFDSEIKLGCGKYCSISCARIGNKNAEGPAWNKGLTKETDERVMNYSGEKHGLWNGGSSFEPYGIEFNKKLKRHIRKEYNHTCWLCGQKENGEKLSVHHIDYDKTNNKPNNLIPLCRSCHIKTNHNRDYWKEKLGE